MPTLGNQSTVIQDFSGGLNTLVFQSRLDPRQTPSASNVWNDDGALAKRPGQFQTSLSNSVYGRSWFGINLHNSVFSAVQNMMISVQAGISRNFVLNTSDAISYGQLSTGGTGTASTAVASAVVTGSGSNWTSTAAVGSIFSIGSTVGIIQSVDSDTQLTLTSNFGALNSGTSYVIVPSWGSTKRLSFADMNQKVWICGQGNSAVSFDGASTLYVSAFPQAAYSIEYSNYIFAANTAANPSRVSWCALKDPTTWPAANFVDVNPNDGFPVIGLFFDGQSVCILKTNSMWKLTGQTFDPANPTYSLTQVYTPSDFFCNSPRTVQLFMDQGFVIYGQKGLYIYNGSGAVVKLLQYDNIRSEWASLTQTNFGGIPDPTAEPTSLLVDGNYWLMFQKDKVGYVIDKTGAIWKWSFANNGIVTDMAYLKGILYGVNSNAAGTPGLIQLNTGSSDAQNTAISANWSSKEFQFNNDHRFGIAYVYLAKESAGNLTFSYSVNGGTYTDVTVDMTAGTKTQAKSPIIMIGQVGNTIQFKVSNNVAAQPFEVYGIEFNHQELAQ